MKQTLVHSTRWLFLVHRLGAHPLLPFSTQDAIAQLVEIASTTEGAPIHIAHVSDADSLEMIAEAGRQGKRITSETCTHYLTFAAEEIPDGSTLHKFSSLRMRQRMSTHVQS